MIVPKHLQQVSIVKGTSDAGSTQLDSITRNPRGFIERLHFDGQCVIRGQRQILTCYLCAYPTAYLHARLFDAFNNISYQASIPRIYAVVAIIISHMMWNFTDRLP